MQVSDQVVNSLVMGHVLALLNAPVVSGPLLFARNPGVSPTYSPSNNREYCVESWLP